MLDILLEQLSRSGTPLIPTYISADMLNSTITNLRRELGELAPGLQEPSNGETNSAGEDSSVTTAPAQGTHFLPPFSKSGRK